MRILTKITNINRETIEAKDELKIIFLFLDSDRRRPRLPSTTSRDYAAAFTAGAIEVLLGSPSSAPPFADGD